MPLKRLAIIMPRIEPPHRGWVGLVRSQINFTGRIRLVGLDAYSVGDCFVATGPMHAEVCELAVCQLIEWHVQGSRYVMALKDAEAIATKRIDTNVARQFAPGAWRNWS